MLVIALVYVMVAEGVIKSLLLHFASFNLIDFLSYINMLETELWTTLGRELHEQPTYCAPLRDFDEGSGRAWVVS